MSNANPIYWDTCIFYEWLGREAVPRDHSDGIQEVLAENEEGSNVIITSVATHLEVLPQKLDQKDDEAEGKYLALFDGERFIDIQISTNVILLAREIRDYYYRAAAEQQKAKMMDLGDCIHLATAIIENASELHTRDNDSKGSKIPLLGLYDYSGQSSVCGKYPLIIKSPIASQATMDV